MRLDLNLATRIYLDRRKVNFVLAATTVILLLLLLVAVRTVFSTAGDIERIKREMAGLEKRTNVSTGAVSEKDLQDVLARIKGVNGIIDRKTVNWIGLLDRLEAVLPEGVAVTSIEPETSKQGLKIALVSRNFPLLRRTLENFEESRFFTNVFLLSQSDVETSGSQKGIAFTVNCRLDYRKL